jgi:hypothetical protein
VSEVVEEPAVQAAGTARTLQTARQQAGRQRREEGEPRADARFIEEVRGGIKLGLMCHRGQINVALTFGETATMKLQ